MTTATTEMIDVALDRIIPNPWQPRQHMDPQGVSELAEDIHAIGRLLQEPMARPAGDGVRYQLAHGHRRVEALRYLHESDRWGATVRLKVEQLSDQDMAYISLSENRARKDLTPAEEISAWAKVLREIEGVTIQSLADKVGVDRTTMSKNLAILDLPLGVLDLVDAGSMSVRAARELLALRNNHHCHEDQIALVLQDVSGLYYRNGRSLEGMEKPPDYRVKTVRASIRALTRGYAHYGDGAGFDEASKTWRPLFDPPNGYGGRRVSFDVAAFKAEFPHQVHVLPRGDESGGAEWTCAYREWGRWSSLASREATKAAKEEGAEAEKGEAASNDVSWWKAVQEDPLIQEFVGEQLSAMTSVKDLTKDDREALGSRVEPTTWDTLIQLPQEAQPRGIMLKYDRASKPPMFDFSQCASCTEGASWLVTSSGAQLVCMNRQKYMDRQSVGMQEWLEWKDAQALRDSGADRNAIGRLSHLDPTDAKGLVLAMWGFVENAEPVKPLRGSQAGSWDERSRYFYYSAGAMSFSAVMDLELPPLTGDEWHRKDKWEEATEAFLADPPEDVDWPLALACVLVWQARVAQGLGADIWRSVARSTDATVEV